MVTSRRAPFAMAQQLSETPIRILVAEDEAAVRDALSDLIASEHGLELVAEAKDADQAIALAESLRPDVALVDVKMPAGGGQRATREIRARSPITRVIALSAYDDRSTVFEMLRAGAAGYLVKGVSGDEIVETVRRAVRGQGALSAQVTADVIDELAEQLELRERESRVRRRRVEEVRRAVAADALDMVFQPIIKLGSGRAIGVEALARFRIDPPRDPDAWFREAAGVGLGVDLELHATRAALEHLHRLPGRLYLSLNLSPDAAASPKFLRELDRVDGGRVVVEVTEHDAVEDYDALDPALLELRSRGGRLAIDDAGSGYASLRHILRLHPEIIKLDITLTRNIDADPARRALATALVSFAGAINAEIVAEGIESGAEVRTLQSLGVRYGQGYYLARPAPLDALDL
jgi:EAL domain-containing protein (putative c-di-GMP-specific phosphodiesterase class I)/DNA-binding NarL/FixJ family response regulator